MPGCDTGPLEREVGLQRYRLRVLNDLQQFFDPDGHGARPGISSTQWRLVGRR